MWSKCRNAPTSLPAAHFLDTLINRIGVPHRALQVDGGSEFAANLNKACQHEG